MDVVDGADERCDPFVPHPVPLHDVEHFLGDQDRGVRGLAEREGLERPAEFDHRTARPVGGGTQLRRPAGEHDGVPALVGYLREGPLETRVGRVGRVDVTQHHLLEDHLEPDAGAGHRGGLLPRQLLALSVGQLAPVRRAVQRAPLGARAVEVLVQRRVPVHLGDRVVRQLRRRAEQPPGDVLLVEPVLVLRPKGAACHGAAPRFDRSTRRRPTATPSRARSTGCLAAGRLHRLLDVTSSKLLDGTYSKSGVRAYPS